MIGFRERDPIKIGIASLIGVAMILAISFSLSSIPFIAKSYAIDASFADAAGIQTQNEVRIAGLKIGKVTSVRLVKDKVAVGMSIQNGTTIPSTSTAEITLNTILGTKFVNIDAKGSGAPLHDGSHIPISQTRIPFEIYQVSNSAVDLLSDIDATKLNEAFRTLANLARDPDRNLAKTLSGTADFTSAIASQSDALDSLVTNADSLLSAIDDSSGDVKALISSSNKVLDVLSKRRATVRSLIRNTDLLTGSLGKLLKDNNSQINTILLDLHSVLVIVDANLADLEEAIRMAGPSSESFARILWTGPWANICVASIDFVDMNRSGAGNGQDPNGPTGPKGCDSSP